MNYYEIQKSVLIPLSEVPQPRDRVTEQLWQTVASGLDHDEAKLRLKQFLSWNKGKEISYRIAKVEAAIQS